MEVSLSTNSGINLKGTVFMITLLKRFLLIAVCITPIVLLVNYSFTSKANDKPDLQNKSSKTASTSEKKIEDPEITLTFSGDTMFDWQLRPVIEKTGLITHSSM